VSALLSSPRRRRRLIWSGACALLVGGIAFSMVHWSNTAPNLDTPVRLDDPAQVDPVPINAPFKHAREEGVLKVAALFVDTAVKRVHVERSYNLVTPTLKTGYTKQTWATQDIPVQPFPLDFAKYQVKGSFRDHVWLQVALFPDKAHKDTVPSAVFDVVLKPYGRGDDRHWLVDSWAPAGYLGIPDGPLGGRRDAKGHVLPPPAVEFDSKLSQRWLLVPLSALMAGVLLLAGLAAGGWWRGRRALRRYNATYR
jgi:hypothetical protein